VSKKEKMLMKAIAKVGLALSLGSAFLFAETWSGKLVDANCEAKQQQKQADCAATASTLSFGIQTADGKVYKLDATGNKGAMEAIKKDGPKASATVSGTLEGTTVKVESIDLK
jgi:hypothetical protein